MTICAECEHYRRWLQPFGPICMADPEINPITGKRRYYLCEHRNRGKCPDFRQRVRWWERLRRWLCS